MLAGVLLSFFFFFNDTATTEIYTLSLHDALPISPRRVPAARGRRTRPRGRRLRPRAPRACAARSLDRKSTRLNSSHLVISYAVFCLKKKKQEYGPGAHPPVRRALSCDNLVRITEL